MGFYARRRWRFLGQLAADVFVIAWGVVWWLVGQLAHDTIEKVATPARQTAVTAGQLSTQFAQAGEQVARVPGLGEELRRPFDGASGSLGRLIDAANQQVAGIDRVADLAGWLVFAIPVAVIVAFWLPRRVAFLLRARAARRFLDSTADLDLFALRALASQPLHVLGRISDDPVAAWRSGDATVISKLAEVELRRSGLPMPTIAPARKSSQGRA